MRRVDRGGSGRPFSEPPVYLSPSVGRVFDFHGYPRNENRGEKVKIGKNISAADARRLAAVKKRVQSASSLRRHLQCVVGKTTYFPKLRTKTSD